MANEYFVDYDNMETLLTGIVSHSGSGSGTSNYIVFSEPDVTIYEGSSTLVYVRTNVNGTLTATSSNSTLVTAQVGVGENGKYIEIQSGTGTGNGVITVSANGTSSTINVTVETPPIYGVEWDGSTSPAWTRTDGAVGFTDPNPYYSGMTTTPSSPFDDISPWKDIKRVTNSTAGELVEIPKFYYKWTRSGNTMKLQISMNQQEGFLCSPAHADRGDGVGERNYVYVGRYHCDTSSYKSTTGVMPAYSITRATFRTNIHNLGTNIWQWDYAMLWTIRMLYLVEYASWDCQAKIGYGGTSSTTSSTPRINMGYTDSMPYHTGTDRTDRTTYGGIQYRYIEGLWDNVSDWVDGIIVRSSYYYCIKNPSNFTDTYSATGVTQLGSRATSSGCISVWSSPTTAGFEYALYPSTTNGTTYTNYCCDQHYYNSSYDTSYTCVYTGGSYNTKARNCGLFYSYCYSSSRAYVGSRLMVLPNN